jgi:hypothetical protein
MIKQTEIRVCDWCKKEITGDHLFIEDVPYEGCSTLYLMDKDHHILKSFEFEESDYCNLECFFNHIKDVIHKEKE